MASLGLHGLAVVIDLIDAIELGIGGIHIFVTDRPHAVLVELEERCPSGWEVAPLFTPQRDRLSEVAHAGKPGEGGWLLLGIIEPGEPSERSAVHALNDYREWLLRRGICAVVIVAGKDAHAADAAYLELQAHAPDFWSVRTRVHRAVGPDLEASMRDELLDLLAPKLGGDRAAAAQWLDGRSIHKDWETYRLWREGSLREAWLELAASSEGTDRVFVRELVMDPMIHERVVHERARQPQVAVGNEIPPERWRRPQWPSGRLDDHEHELVRALGAALDRDGRAELWYLPEYGRVDAATTAVLTLGLLRESRHPAVVHIDASQGLEHGIDRCLRDAGETSAAPESVGSISRLRRALGETDALLLVTEVGEAALELLRAGIPDRAIVASVRGWPTATFCVVVSPGLEAYGRWAVDRLSTWPRGATMQRIRAETAVLELRAALCRAGYVVVLCDRSWNDLRRESLRPLETVSHRVAAFALGLDAPPAALPWIPWHGELGSTEALASAKLLGLAWAMAGAPVSEPPSRQGVAWPSMPSEDAAPPSLDPAQLDLALEDQQHAWSRWMHAHGYEPTNSWMEGCFRTAAALELTGPVERTTLPMLVDRVLPSRMAQAREALVGCFVALHGDSTGSMVTPLEPEAVGEALLARILAQDEQEEGSFDRWSSLPFMDGMPSSALTHTLTVLTRLARRSIGRGWLQRLLREHAAEIVDRAVRTANAGRPEPPGTVLEQSIELLEDGRVAEAIGDAIPQSTMELRRAKVTAYEIAVRAARSAAEADEMRLASLLVGLGAALDEIGKPEEGLRATREAVEIDRRLAGEQPEAFLPELAIALRNLGILLDRMGEREDALQATQEAAAVYRRLAAEQPDVFPRKLAGALDQLGVRLVDLGRMEEALEASREAVEILRRLATEQPNAALPDLAGALNNLGIAYSELGRPDDALRASQEAVDRYRRLAEAQPDALLPNLATALQNLGSRLARVGRLDDALAVEQEAVAIRRRLVERYPDVFLPGLAGILLNLGIALHARWNKEGALQATVEAVEIYRRLSERRPGVFLAYLANALNTLGSILAGLGRREQALEATQESVERYRGLAEQRPDAFLPGLAMSLSNLGRRLDQIGRRREALLAAREAVEIYRNLAEQRPDAYLPDLANALWACGAQLLDAGKHRQAIDVFAEGARLVQPVYERLPAMLRDRALESLREIRRVARQRKLRLPRDVAAWLERVVT